MKDTFYMHNVQKLTSHLYMHGACTKPGAIR